MCYYTNNINSKLYDMFLKNTKEENKLIKKLVSSGIIKNQQNHKHSFCLGTENNDLFTKHDYAFYSVASFDYNKIRLAIWIGGPIICWLFITNDSNDKNKWYPLYKFPNLKHGYIFKEYTVWRNDFNSQFMHGYKTPELWLKAFLKTQIIR